MFIHSERFTAIMSSLKFNKFKSATCNLQIRKMLTSESEAQLAYLVICVLESQRKLSVVFPSVSFYGLKFKWDKQFNTITWCWCWQYTGRMSCMNQRVFQPTMESLWFSGRWSECRIRKSELCPFMGTQIISFVPCSWAKGRKHLSSF